MSELASSPLDAVSELASSPVDAVSELASSPVDAVSAVDVVTNVVGGLVALALLVYLCVALLRPERF